MTFLTYTANRNLLVLLVFIVSLVAGSCAAMQPPDASGPGSGGPPYPVLFTELSQRRESSLNALNRLVQSSDATDQNQVYLHPVTATIKSLPTKLATPLYLPKVGSNPEMNEEETREALRRFINDWPNLIGASSSQLSLIERLDQADRTRIARYEQRPFRFPLRGDYGKLEMHFTADRRLLNLSSSCIPEAERVQASLAIVIPKVQADDAIKRAREQELSYFDSAGNRQNYRLSSTNEVTAGELVTYVIPSTSQPDSLEFHIAWEIAVSNAPFKTVYVDVLRDEIIGAR